MNRIITAACILTAFAGCNSNRPPINSDPVNVSGWKDGLPVVTSYAGRASAGGGQVSDTAEAEIVKALAEKIDGANFTYASASRSAIDQPDVKIEQEIETKHKAALTDAAQALAAGAQGNYAKAAAEAASLGAQLIQLRQAKANRPQPDSGAIVTRVLASGEGHGPTAQLMAAEFGATLRAQGRASYGLESSTKDIDTTEAGDIKAAGQVVLDLAKLQAELAKAKAAAAIKPPPVNAPSVAPSPGNVSTNAPPVAHSGDPAARARAWYPDLASGGGNEGKASEVFLWKPVSDSNGKAAVHTPASLRIDSLTVAGQVHKAGAYGNGYRPLFRLDKPGSGYGANVPVTLNLHDGRKVNLTIPNGGTRWEKSGLTPTGAAVPTAPEVPLLNGGPTPIPPPQTSNPPATGGALFFTAPNAITLRDDFAAAVGKIDALTAIQDPHGPGRPASPSSVAIQATRTGNTWTLPGSLEGYPKGNVPNTWRIRLNKTPPAGVTYHTSINQSFVRVGDNPYGPGNKTYPPTTRQ